jgi:hypothetical protein
MLKKYEYDESSILGNEMERGAEKSGLQMVDVSSTFSERLGSGALYILTHHMTEPPSSIIKFSPNDGASETFFHKGFLRYIATRDVDGDGASELLATGYNYVLGVPVIVVLDPAHIRGSSPQLARYNISDEYRDIARYYIKLPDYHRFERYASRFYPLHVRIIENSDILRILIRSRTESVVYTLTDDMKFVRTEVVTVTKKLGRGNNLTMEEPDFPEREEEERKLLEGVRYWDGENWTSAPVENRSYLKAINNKGG